MTGTAIHRLAEAIRYPDRIPEDVVSFVLRVDGMEIAAEESGARLTLKYLLTEDEGLFGRLAELAAGRMLKEEAVLAAEPQTGGLFLWQAEDANASAHNLLRLFETFVNSCDWWRERVASVSDERLQFGPDEMIMRP
ncbi:MAG: hypothetical protein J6P80_05220 [Kiritimatiellae bacterium]|nr:hypothetical protein [Kiritimatiellia bacterium]